MFDFLCKFEIVFGKPCLLACLCVCVVFFWGDERGLVDYVFFCFNNHKLSIIAGCWKNAVVKKAKNKRKQEKEKTLDSVLFMS